MNIGDVLTDSDRDVIERARQWAASKLGMPSPRPREQNPPLSEDRLRRSIDATLLSPTTTGSEIDELCEMAVQFGVRGVCVNPRWIPRVSGRLKQASTVAVAVIDFPLGASSPTSRRTEALEAVANGAREIDVVGDLARVRSREWRAFRDELAEFCGAVRVPVKVILETGLLQSTNETARAALTAAAGGAAFVKTSTGWAYRKGASCYERLGASRKDVAVLLAAVGDWVGVKASGGIETRDTAIEMLDLGADRIGTSKLIAVAG